MRQAGKISLRDKMTSNLTGHAEIDQQHELLDCTVGQLKSFCTEASHNPDAACEDCHAVKQKHCQFVLETITKELTDFLAGHTAYEEKMMELLPDTPVCQRHVKAHKSAHQGIANQLKNISLQLDKENPRGASMRIKQIVGDWLDDHCPLFDTRLVSLGKFDTNRIDFDAELVTMLDEYVFPNRPTTSKASLRVDAALLGEKLETRQRFESLSPAQRQIFWLIATGKKNREMTGILNVSINTVKTHRAAVFHKMDVRSALELAKKADALH